jgi:hypothetical protein
MHSKTTTKKTRPKPGLSRASPRSISIEWTPPEIPTRKPQGPNPQDQNTDSMRDDNNSLTPVNKKQLLQTKCKLHRKPLPWKLRPQVMVHLQALHKVVPRPQGRDQVSRPGLRQGPAGIVHTLLQFCHEAWDLLKNASVRAVGMDPLEHVQVCLEIGVPVLWDCFLVRSCMTEGLARETGAEAIDPFLRGWAIPMTGTTPSTVQQLLDAVEKTIVWIHGVVHALEVIVCDRLLDIAQETNLERERKCLRRCKTKPRSDQRNIRPTPAT